MDDIQHAQMIAGENAVIERLRAKGLLPPDPAAERARLKDAVVEAAKAWRDDVTKEQSADGLLIDAVDALIEFEQQHG